MPNRGKFKSLIMVNWNGFFARKFDLDESVTTLSGGNGAGKSTTMAAFITALIPDLSLLHFRNTTEAGSTSSSRDRGLHGKLKSGVCFAALECENSRGDIVIFGVRLQQIAGRDKKVDLKMFSIQGLDGSENAINLFFEQMGDKAKILNVNELKTKYDGSGKYTFKQYHTIGDYHGQMFDYGILSKRLRAPQDRAYFYRLIEASLYGGISSTITKSLREYLLPENTSVKRAFQDMEAAILENRMTLDKIEQTRADRDFFRSLVDTSVNYVAADYIYQQNMRKDLINNALHARKQVFTLVAQLAKLEQSISSFAGIQQQLEANHQALRTQYQEANEHYSLLVNASRIQTQYDRLLATVQQLEEEQAMQQDVVADLAGDKLELEENLNTTEERVNSLRRQLADSQTALDQQQTRQVQYKQAVAKLAQLVHLLQQDAFSAKEMQALTEYVQVATSENFSIDQVSPLLTQAQTLLQSTQSQYYNVKNSLEVHQSSRQEYDQAFKSLTKLLNGVQVTPTQAYNQAQVLVNGLILKRDLAQRSSQLEREYHSLSHKRDTLATSQSQITQLQQQLGQTFNNRAELAEAFDINQATYADFDYQKEQYKDELARLSSELGVLSRELETLNAQRMPYFVAQDELAKLNSKLPQPLIEPAQVREQLDHYLVLANQQQIELTNLNAKREELHNSIHALDKQGMGIDQQLQDLAQDLGGVLLSEIYDDITINDASYYSALYGPARDAIVLPSFEGIEAKLEAQQNLPADLYLIEGDFSNFNEDIFNRINHDNAVLVRINDTQIRYSTFQEVTTFGKAAREKYIEAAKNELKEVLYQISQVEPAYYQHKKLSDSLTSFVSQHMDVAFRANPEAQAAQLNKQASGIEREINQLKDQLQIISNQTAELNRKNGLLSKLMNVFSDEAGDNLEQDFLRVKSELQQAQAAQRYLQQYRHDIEQLEQHYATLKYPVQDVSELTAQKAQLEQHMSLLTQVMHLCEELETRKEHFNYAVLGELSGDDLSQQLRTQLDKAETMLARTKTQLKDLTAQYEQQRTALFQLEANLNAARQTLESLNHSLAETGTSITSDVLAKAKTKAEQLLAQAEAVSEELATARNEHRNNQDKITAIQSQFKDAQRTYSLQRRTVLDSKQKWQQSQAIAHQHGLVHRLLNPELRTLSNEVLRSTSDRALGQLRSLIQDNEYLRDSLKASEDNRRPYLKVQFFVDVFNHLRERIRQDILTTSDPVEAIEQMEIQLDRLSSQLTQREQSLVISAEEVANLLDKTVEREQDRIWKLNQGLEDMKFGQVKSVRLNAVYRDTHLRLLNALREGREKHSDLFDNNELSFTEALAKLYQRTNVEFDIGQRNFQTVGEELLDYRNYIELSIEVYRGSDGWLKAESGALSTGEAIGTGMSILLMVVQSWEAESQRLRAKDLSPCRLLFLDEAARLDATSIATLFELCEKQQMQLLIAAPENISPDNGTTYKLVRKVDGKKEYVQVVGLRGFGTNKKVTTPSTPATSDTATATN